MLFTNGYYDSVKTQVPASLIERNNGESLFGGESR